MEITIKGDLKEIATLVLNMQEMKEWKYPSDNLRHAEGAVYDNETGKIKIL